METTQSNIVIRQKQLSYGLIELRSDNILVFRPDVQVFKEYTIEILKELRDEFVEITDGVPRPYMCDNRYITGIVTKEEKEYINAHMGEFATQMAMITHSPVVKLLVNTYNAMFNPKQQIKLFRKEEDAVKWLRECEEG